MSPLKMTNTERLNYLFEMMGRHLALCCHRQVGNLPTLPRRGTAATCERTGLA